MADPVMGESARSMALGGFGEKFMLIVVRLPVMKSSPQTRRPGAASGHDLPARPSAPMAALPQPADITGESWFERLGPHPDSRSAAKPEGNPVSVAREDVRVL